MIVVVGVAVGASVFAPGTSAFSAVEAIEAVPGSHTMAALEVKREQLIAMTAAARTLTVVAKPKLTSPTQVAAADVAAGTSTGRVPAPEQAAGESSTSRPRRLTREPRNPPPTT